MHVPRVLQLCWPAASSPSLAEVDAEILAEFQFHLDMRTQDNLLAGMSPEAAQQDAQRRFGDFEACHRACRAITLGPRLVFQRFQTGVIVLLVGAVIYQGRLQFRMQSDSQVQIDSLTRMVAELQATRAMDPDMSTAMPYVQWDLAPPRNTGVRAVVADAEHLADWGSAQDSLEHPWSNWQALADPAEGL